jgi:hypothetical protein
MKEKMIMWIVGSNSGFRHSILVNAGLAEVLSLSNKANLSFQGMEVDDVHSSIDLFGGRHSKMKRMSRGDSSIVRGGTWVSLLHLIYLGNLTSIMTFSMLV